MKRNVRDAGKEGLLEIINKKKRQVSGLPTCSHKKLLAWGKGEEIQGKCRRQEEGDKKKT